MARRSMLLLVTLGAALALAGAVGTASANRLSLSNRSFRITWTPMTYWGGTAMWEIRCNITIEGSFHSTSFAKVAGALIGYVTSAVAQRPCAGDGHWWMLNGREVLEGVTTTNTLPWHIRYRSFSGTLPSMTSLGIDVVGYSFLRELTGYARCLYRSTAENPVRWNLSREAGGVITGVVTDATSSLPLNSGPILCPTVTTFEGTGRLTLLGNTTAISLRLI